MTILDKIYQIVNKEVESQNRRNEKELWEHDVANDGIKITHKTWKKENYGKLSNNFFQIYLNPLSNNSMISTSFSYFSSSDSFIYFQWSPSNFILIFTTSKSFPIQKNLNIKNGSNSQKKNAKRFKWIRDKIDTKISTIGFDLTS